MTPTYDTFYNETEDIRKALFELQKIKTARMSKEEELELWKRWKKEPTNNNLRPLLKSLSPIIDTHVNKMHGNLPKSALKAQMTNLTIKALDRYDPDKAQLNTYLYNTAGQKLHRYVYTYQNMGSIPEPRIIQIGTYKRIKSNLEEDLGREPTFDEVADEMKVDPKQLRLLEKEMRSDLVQDINFINVIDDQAGDVDEKIMLLHSELFGRDREVLEYIYGLEGKPQLSNTEIANKLGINQSMVTHIKSRLAKRLKESGALRGY